MTHLYMASILQVWHDVVASSALFFFLPTSTQNEKCFRFLLIFVFVKLINIFVLEVHMIDVVILM